MRILQVDSLKKLDKLMQEIKVDPYGIKIMRHKGIIYLIKMDSVSNIAANILKQEMLSLGGDVAVSRDALTGRAKKTGCLVMGNLSQINRLSAKLIRQPFGLAHLSSDISQAVDNYQKDRFSVEAGSYRLNLSRRPHIMGIVNLTPDSFSGDGMYKSSIQEIIDFVERMIEDGADIIDMGGESTRPGAMPVSAKEEISRTAVVIKQVARKIKRPVSIDTYKPEVAKAALDNGAVMINDITGLRNPKMLKIAAHYKAAVVIMHMKGMPHNMQKNPYYESLLDEIIKYLHRSIERALEAGIDKNRIIIDPGLGFGKTLIHNLEIINHLKEFKILGYPLLIGPSRKSFIGRISGAGVEERLPGTIAASVLSVVNGANLVRVHDVNQVKQAMKIMEAMNNADS